VAAIGLAMVLVGPFMTATLASFTHQIFDRIVTIGGS
jgi:flagellar biosynthesis protein FliQ